MMSGKARFERSLQQDISDLPTSQVRCYKNLIKRNPLCLRSIDRYINKDPESNSIWMNYSTGAERIKHKIAQTQDTMHSTQERAVTHHVWPEIAFLELGIE